MSAFRPSLRWSVPLTTTLVWALAAASMVFWGLRLSAPAAVVAPPTVSAVPAAVDSAAVGRALGALPAPLGPRNTVMAPAASSRFTLLGLVAGNRGKGGQDGAALIAVDGQAPRPYRLGQTVVDGYRLQTLGAREATLGTDQGAQGVIRLQLPEREAGAPRIMVAATGASPMSGAMPSTPAMPGTPMMGPRNRGGMLPMTPGGPPAN